MFLLVPGPPQAAPPIKRPHLALPSPAAGIVPFSPMEQMEELTADVATAASYCDDRNSGGNVASSVNNVGYGGDGNNSSLEDALGINFHDGVQRELVAK